MEQNGANEVDCPSKRFFQYYRSNTDLVYVVFVLESLPDYKHKNQRSYHQFRSQHTSKELALGKRHNAPEFLITQY